MNRRLLSGILLAAFSVMAASALACSCIGRPGTVMEEYGWADTVFLGSVRTVVQPTGWNHLLVEIQVESTWKGDPGALVLVITELSSAACGIEFQEGENWVVFGTDIVHEGVTGFYTHLCTLTTREDYAAGIIAELGPVSVREMAWGALKSCYR
jgi:hypothetical protein